LTPLFKTGASNLYKTLYQLEIKPNDADAYYNRGNSYTKLGKYEYELAIADFNQSLKIVPNAADAYINRGLAYAELGKYELARTDLERAKQLFLAQGDAASAENAESILRDLP
jgi:tetratricopeptide (TPR) repeat protein